MEKTGQPFQMSPETTEGFSPLPYVATLLNSGMWIAYSSHNPLMILTYTAGIITEATYITIFYGFSTHGVRVRMFHFFLIKLYVKNCALPSPCLFQQYVHPIQLNVYVQLILFFTKLTTFCQRKIRWLLCADAVFYGIVLVIPYGGHCEDAQIKAFIGKMSVISCVYMYASPLIMMVSV